MWTWRSLQVFIRMSFEGGSKRGGQGLEERKGEGRGGGMQLMKGSRGTCWQNVRENNTVKLSSSFPLTCDLNNLN